MRAWAMQWWEPSRRGHAKDAISMGRLLAAQHDVRVPSVVRVGPGLKARSPSRAKDVERTWRTPH